MISACPIVRSGLVLAQTGVVSAAADKNYALWAIVLIGVAVVLFFLEVVVPSGGIIAILSATALVAGIVLLFRVNTTFGLVSAIVSLIAVPFLFGFALKLWPNTPIAQMLLLKSPPRATPGPEGQTDNRSLHALAGASGQALTDLRPVGTCLIEGRRLQCLAESGLIGRGSHVKVVSENAMGVKVRIDASVPTGPSSTSKTTPADG